MILAARIVLAAAIVLCITAACAEASPRHVLLLYDERVELPGLSALDASITESLIAGSPDGVEIYRESLDLSRFGTAEYLQQFREYLRTKYRGVRVDLAIAAMEPSLQFLLAYGAEIVPGTPIVFCGIDVGNLAHLQLPPGMTGIVLKRRFASTVELALRLQPRTRHVLVVAGTSAFDSLLLQQARAEFREFEDRLVFEYVTDLPLRDAMDRVSRLPRDTIVLFTTMLRDGAGQPHVPHEAIQAIAASASVPVYAFVDQYLGRGIVGGDLYSLGEHGSRVAAVGLRILRGEDPAQIAPSESTSSQPMFDARQLRRWKLDEGLLPAGAMIKYRERSLWREYRAYIAAAITIMLLQSATIAAMLLQRRRRRRAEIEVQSRRVELAHATRLATLGQLTATIAHEVNQPLGAILANVATADMLLASEHASRDELRDILADIRRDDVRASEVIKRLRALLARREMVRESIDIAEVILDVVAILRVEAKRRRVELSFMPDLHLPRVVGDRVHLQQVVLNLVLNAMDAMSDTHVSARRVVIHAKRQPAGDVEVAVRDFGHGIPADRVAHLFQSFYTTKVHGMGLGLSICRSIVEAHGGRIWAETSAQGATFRFTLPVDGATSALRPAGAPRESSARPAAGSERYSEAVARAPLARHAADR